MMREIEAPRTQQEGWRSIWGARVTPQKLSKEQFLRELEEKIKNNITYPWRETDDNEDNDHIDRMIEEEKTDVYYRHGLNIRLHRHKDLTFSHVVDNPDIDWNWSWISVHPNITFSDVLSRLDLPWDWSKLSLYLRITMQDLVDHPDLPWVWKSPKSPYSPIFIHHVSDSEKYLHICSWGVSYNTGITYSDMMAHPEFEWEEEAFYRKSDYPIKSLVKKYAESGWTEEKLIKKYPEMEHAYRYDWPSISAHPGLGIEDFLELGPDTYLWWDFISMNPNITALDVYNYSWLPWSYENLDPNLVEKM
jgi:hypothetical protein